MGELWSYGLLLSYPPRPVVCVRRVWQLQMDYKEQKKKKKKDKEEEDLIWRTGMQGCFWRNLRS